MKKRRLEFAATHGNKNMMNERKRSSVERRRVPEAAQNFLVLFSGVGSGQLVLLAVTPVLTA